MPLQLKSVRDDLDGPRCNLCFPSGFEAEFEVSGVFGVDAEGVHGAFRVGFCVGFEPFVC